MTVLSDETIRGLLADKVLVIEPEPQDWQIQPASVDLTLGPEFLSPYGDGPKVHREHYTILPGECILGTTIEKVSLPPNIVARVEGKSSWGRRFVITHATAGFIDPGFTGTITLELVNHSRVIQVLPVGAAICQISFQYLDKPADRPYGSPLLTSHYQNQQGVTPSALPWP